MLRGPQEKLEKCWIAVDMVFEGSYNYSIFVGCALTFFVVL